ncbi:MAG: hypothetical protein ACRDCC_10545, partial [Culicoidibacterales bacterium]
WSVPISAIRVCFGKYCAIVSNRFEIGIIFLTPFSYYIVVLSYHIFISLALQIRVFRQSFFITFAYFF